MTVPNDRPAGDFVEQYARGDLSFEDALAHIFGHPVDRSIVADTFGHLATLSAAKPQNVVCDVQDAKPRAGQAERVIASALAVALSRAQDLVDAPFPWVQSLPRDELQAFVMELVAALQSAESIGSPTVVAMIEAWRHAAGVFAEEG